MKSTLICVSTALALAAAAPFVFAASAERKEAQARILEQTSIPCSNCFFGRSEYYFCFAADNKILLAQDKIPTFNWHDNRRNFFGKVYGPWKRPSTSGDTITIQYDDEHVWIPRTGGKQLRLKQDYSRDIFTNQQCRSAVRNSAIK